jgi:hypothetical protein
MFIIYTLGDNFKCCMELGSTLCQSTGPMIGKTTTKPNIFLRICTHTQTIPISSDLCPPMPTHSMTCAHPYPPMLFKLRLCIQKLCNMYYLPTSSLSWIGQIKGHSLSLATAQSASWLAYSMHMRSLTLIWSWIQGCTKPIPPMPTHE